MTDPFPLRNIEEMRAEEVRVREPQEGDDPVTFGFRSAHIYAGLLVLAVGGEAIYGGLGLVLAGVTLLYLGVWRMG